MDATNPKFAAVTGAAQQATDVRIFHPQSMGAETSIPYVTTLSTVESPKLLQQTLQQAQDQQIPVLNVLPGYMGLQQMQTVPTTNTVSV